MARMQDITLTGAGSPGTDHVLRPQSLVNNLGVWRELTGSFVERQWLTVTVRPDDRTNSGQKTTVRLNLPHPVDVSDACCVDKNTPLPASYVTVEFFRNRVAPDATILNLIAELQDLVATADITNLFKGEGLMG